MSTSFFEWSFASTAEDEVTKKYFPFKTHSTCNTSPFEYIVLNHFADKKSSLKRIHTYRVIHIINAEVSGSYIVVLDTTKDGDWDLNYDKKRTQSGRFSIQPFNKNYGKFASWTLSRNSRSRAPCFCWVTGYSVIVLFELNEYER